MMRYDNRPDFVKDEHLKFLDKGMSDKFKECGYQIPFTKMIVDEFNIDEATARRIVYYWFSMYNFNK